MSNKYILDGHTPKLEHDLIAWAKWFETADRRVAKTNVGDRDVSTVFLGINHGFDDGQPLLFETMIFDSDLNDVGYQERCSTWAEAESQHLRGVEIAKGSLLAN